MTAVQRAYFEKVLRSCRTEDHLRSWDHWIHQVVKRMGICNCLWALHAMREQETYIKRFE